MKELFTTLLYNPLLQGLLFLDSHLGNFGLAVIGLTLLIRGALLPVTLPSLRTASKMKELQPKLKKIKEKHKDDQAAFQQAQLALFKEHGVNPAAGCLPQIVQLVIFITLYRVFIDFLQTGLDQVSTIQFLWLDLSQPDSMYILPVLAAVSQFVLGLMIAPGADTAAEQTLAASTKDKKDDKQAEDMSAMASSMQQQMMYIMPFMTGFIALRFPSGLALYWVVSTVFSIAVQYYVSGWGGLQTKTQALVVKIQGRK